MGGNDEYWHFTTEERTVCTVSKIASSTVRSDITTDLTFE